MTVGVCLSVASADDAAATYGARGHRPDSVAELTKTLVATGRSHGVHLIDVAIDYSDNDRILSQEVKRLSAAV